VSERLKELQRQRALALEQVAWFDREIARETNGSWEPTPVSAPPLSPLTKAATVVPFPPAQGGVPSASPIVADAAAEKILDRYRPEGQSIQNDVRRGCFLYFFTALAIVGLAVVAFYFLRPYLLELKQ